MIKDLLRVRYQAAVSKMAELREKYQDKEEIDYNFHPQAGNALSLAFGKFDSIQPIFIPLRSPRKNFRKIGANKRRNISVTV